MRFSLSRCPMRGATRKLDMDITAVAISNRPSEMVHCRIPMRDWYRWISSPSRSSESSSSGWSPFRSGEVYKPFGLFPKMLSNCRHIRSMYALGPTHSTPSSSRKKSQPRWNVVGPVPFNLKLFGAEVRASMIAWGFFDAIMRSST